MALLRPQVFLTLKMQQKCFVCAGPELKILPLRSPWIKLCFNFYAREQLLLSARLSHRNSVYPSITWVDQAKTVQARITKSSLSAAWKTLVSGTVKLFHKFEGGHPERGP